MLDVEKYWKKLGPGLITGAADDDPSGIATYSQAGARYGFGLLWMAVFTFPFMAIVQEMCARIGLVTGRGLAANIRSNYSKSVLYVCTILLFIANTFNIGADLGAMAAGVRLLAPRANFFLLIIGFALLSLLLQIFVRYTVYARYLKYLTFTLFAYIITAFVIDTDWSTVLAHAVIPTLHWSREYLFLMCAVLGTTISPYLFFWQTGQEIQEEIAKGDTTIKERQEDIHPRTIRAMRTDVWSGMFLSNLVMFFIIVTSAVALSSHGITNIASAADAATALKPFAGQWAFLLFTIGIIGTGLLAIPVLAGGTSYALSESFRLPRKSFYGVLALSVLVGLLINFLHIDPIKALLYSAVLNGLIAPIILFLIVRLSSNATVMGNYANGRITKTLGWIITIIMALVGIAVIVSLI